MMLIEPDKRGKEFAIPLTYSSPEETFFVPDNVYLIGMMNTVDRSLAMVLPVHCIGKGKRSPVLPVVSEFCMVTSAGRNALTLWTDKKGSPIRRAATPKRS